MYNDYYDSYLAHHGIKGMKWGIRRYQNEDGTLTEAGLKRYGQGNHLLKTNRNIRKDVRKMRRNMIKDTIRESFSGERKINRNDVPAIVPYAGRAVSNLSKFDKGKFANAMNRNKQVAANYKSHMESTYGDKYKKMKRRQIMKAVGTAGALAAVTGTVLAANAYKNNQDPQYRAAKQYKKQNKTVERIKNNPNAYNAGNKYAKKPGR